MSIGLVPPIGITVVADNYPMTVVRRAANQSITTGTWTLVSWDTLVADEVGAWGGGGSPTIFTVPAGYTKIRCTLRTIWAVNNTGSRYFVVTKNTTNEAGAFFGAINDAQDESFTNGISPWETVAPGDIIRFMVLQSSGGNLNLAGTAFPGNGTLIQIEWR